MMHGTGSASTVSSPDASSPSSNPAAAADSPGAPFGVVVRDAVAATLAGDRDGPQRLFATLRPWLLSGMRAKHRPGQPGNGDAEDLTQDICVELLRSLSTYRGTPDQFLAWVYRIVTRTMADFYSRHERDRSTPTEQVPDTPDPGDDPERHAELALQHGELAALVDHHLRSGRRDVLHHRFLAGLSVAETAAAMGITVGSARVLQHRALAELRTAINNASGAGDAAQRQAGEHSTARTGRPRRRASRRPSTTAAGARVARPLTWQPARWAGSTPRCPTCTAEAVMADGGWSCPQCTSPRHTSVLGRHVA